MASKDITKNINNLLDHGMTIEQIMEECGLGQYEIRIDMVISKGWAKKHNITRSQESFVQNMRLLDRWNTWYENKIQAISRAEDNGKEEPEKAKAEPLATERQINLILRLISQGKHLEGGYISGPTEYQGVSQMTRRAASAYIDSLLGNY